MKKKWQLVFVLFLLLITTGCLYPNDRLAKNQVSNDLQLQTVQQAVESYREAKTGLLPIKNRNSDTPIFIKYPVDFNALKQNGFLASTPGNAFEEGGFYQYVIINVETNPTVKVIDLRMTEKLRQLNVQLEMYRNKHLYPPFGEMISNGVYNLNHEKIGLDEPPYVVSPYSQDNLPIVIDTNGELFIDYSKDLYRALKDFPNDYEQGDDIRYILAEQYPFVPAYSLPYTIKDGEPVFFKE
ncbi:hypothetical protein HNQ94_000643 [Salirhabdus euzebyi]|uniref:ABC transporter periplasmic binding protein yphF n=1 Tax=Salirhabdus euzebyi TaxID=394506 RepID=A0A841Q312_9BACI|nr:hypothetical protein [Salirhabdus euzebyi]MBB6452198.1 hypothetical protein [Salirhabdus euzebyi]